MGLCSMSRSMVNDPWYKRIPATYLSTLLLGVLMMVAIFSFTRISLSNFRDIFSVITGWDILFLFVLYSFHIGFAAARWKMLILGNQKKVSHNRGLFIYNITLGQLAKYLPVSSVASAGAKLAGLKLDGNVRYERTLRSVLLEWIFNMAVLGVLSTVAIAASSFDVSELCIFFLAASLFLLAGGLLVFFFNPLSSLFSTALVFTVRLFRKGALVSRILEAMSDEIGDERISRQGIVVMYLFTCAFYAFAIVRLWAMALLFGDISLVQIMIVFPVMMGISLVAFTPGGLGVMEVGWTGAMIFLGMSQEDALAFALLKRVMDDPSMCVLVIGSKLTMLLSQKEQQVQAKQE